MSRHNDDPPTYESIVQPCVYLARATLVNDTKIYLKFGYTEDLEYDRKFFENAFATFELRFVQRVNSAEEGARLLKFLYEKMEKEENVQGTIIELKIGPGDPSA